MLKEVTDAVKKAATDKFFKLRKDNKRRIAPATTEENINKII